MYALTCTHTHTHTHTLIYADVCTHTCTHTMHAHTHTQSLLINRNTGSILIDGYDSSEMDSSCLAPSEAPEVEPCFKKFKYLSSVVSEKLKAQATSRASTPNHTPQQERLETYLSDQSSVLDEKIDTIHFWVQNQEKYPDLAPVAFDLLIIPATSTPIERVFSAAGLVIAGKRNRLSATRLEREVFIKKNKSFL